MKIALLIFIFIISISKNTYADTVENKKDQDFRICLSKFIKSGEQNLLESGAKILKTVAACQSLYPLHVSDDFQIRRKRKK